MNSGEEQQNAIFLQVPGADASRAASHRQLHSQKVPDPEHLELP